MNNTLNISRRAISARRTLAAAILVLSAAGSAFDQPFVSNILGAPAEAAPKGSGGKTALMVAAERGDLQGVKRQLAAGANINATSKQTLDGVQYKAFADRETESYTAGFLARNRSEALQSASGLGHETALMLAIKGGHLEVMQHLLDAGADVNAGGGVYCEPETGTDSCVLVPKAIGWATLGERPDMVELLLQKGAKASDGLIGAAAADGQTGIVRLLLEHKAPADPGLKPAAAKGQNEAVRILLDAGAKINSQEGDWCGKTALIHAAEGGHTETVRLLLARGADKNINSHIDEVGACDGDGTALDYATRNGHKQTASVLKGEQAPTASAEAATPAKTQSDGKSWIESLRGALKPATPAKTQPDSSAANTLLAAAKSKVAAGADAKALNEELDNAIGDSCIGIGIGSEFCDCVTSSYAPAAAEDRLEAARFLLDNGANVNRVDETFLGKVLGLLAQMNFSCEDNAIQAASEGINKMAVLFVSRGANLKNSEAFYGSGVAAGTQAAAPLAVAAQYGNLELVRALIEKGANVNKDGECAVPAIGQESEPLECSSVLELAAEKGNAEVIKLLLDKGAKSGRKKALTAAQSAIRFAESEAQKAQYREVISLLESAGGKKGAQKRK